MSGHTYTHTYIHTHTHTYTHDNYYNPRCACAPGVNEQRSRDAAAKNELIQVK